MDTSPEQIRDIAVKVVENFINNKVPLSQAVAEISKSLSLNSEQIKRVIEASNSIAYLKLLEKSEDRTFEFPVAEYSAVMRLLVMPEDSQTQTLIDAPVMNKEANEVESSFELSSHEKHMALFNEMVDNKAQLEKLAYDIQGVGMLIEKSILALKKDPEGLDKLAELAEESCYNKVSMVMHGMVKEASTGSIYRDADLYEARNLVSLFKQAESILVEKKQREEIHEKIANIVGDVIGGTLKGVAKYTGKAIGGAAGGVVGAAGKTVGKVLRTSNPEAPGKTMFRPAVGTAALAVLGGAGIKATNGPDAWDALN